MSDPTRWSTAADLRSLVRRRWDDGTLLRALVSGESFPVIDVPLRAPGTVDLGEHYEEARRWTETIRRESRSGAAFDLVEEEIGGRLAGRTSRPRRAVLSRYDQAWTLLGTARDAAAFVDMIAAASPSTPSLDWALAHPIRALGLRAEWEAVTAAAGWLDEHRGTGLHIRQITAAGVDSKLIERHRGALAGMLGVPSGASSFARALGLAEKPAIVRLRFDPALFGLPSHVTEASFRAEELRQWRATPRHALIVENEISYLSAPVGADSVVLWGKGFDVENAASLDWLGSASVSYWGDIDSHGFAILDRVRAHLPATRSALMDRSTLLAHEERWGREPTPTTAGLVRLTADESSLYADLVADRYGPRIRLEQERIDWRWASERLEAARAES